MLDTEESESVDAEAEDDAYGRLSFSLTSSTLTMLFVSFGMDGGGVEYFGLD